MRPPSKLCSSRAPVSSPSAPPCAAVYPAVAHAFKMSGYQKTTKTSPSVGIGLNMVEWVEMG